MTFPTRPFLEVFEDASGGNIKTPQTEFLAAGDVPVVDQGQALVAGFVNDRSRICKAKPPVIVFGDHTRALKYVDFEFAMGADGTKVLVPKVESDTKYLYYALKGIEIPAAGYSRHYKFLKETAIPLPPLAEQKRIAAILEAADALRTKRRESLTHLDTLLQSTFLDMFGDPVTNPKEWKQTVLTEALGLINGRAFKTSEWSDRGLPIIRIQNVKNSTEPFNRFAGRYEGRHLVKKGDILLCWAGQLVSIGVHRWDREDGLLNQHIFKVIPRFDGDANFITYMLGFVIDQAKANFRGIEMKHLTKADLARQKIIVPPTNLQNSFGAVCDSVAQQKALRRAHLAELDKLFASLRSRAFHGDL